MYFIVIILSNNRQPFRALYKMHFSIYFITIRLNLILDWQFIYNVVKQNDTGFSL